MCCLEPKGVTSVPMVYMMRNGMLMRAMGWHQGYHAMAAWRDLDLAVDWLYSMFHLRDEFGQLPDGATAGYKVMLATKPPFQGFALSYILDRVGLDALTEEHCKKLYEPMTDWINWWRGRHDLGDGFISYIHADESGWDDSTLFNKGLPVESADIMAFLVLLEEVCGKLAGRLGRAEERSYWTSESEKLLDLMLKTFWNGEKFVARLTKTHEVVEYDSIAAYQPIILGKRLPQPVIDRIAEAVGNPKTFFTSRCFVSESLESDYYDVNGPFMMGMIIAPVQLMMTVGLYNAGKTALALEAARRWTEMSFDLGPTTVTRDVDSPRSRVVPKTLPDGAAPVFPQGGSIPGGMSSWGAAVFLVLAELAEYGRGGCAVMAVMLGTNRRFDLTRVPFTADGSLLVVFQAVDDKGLYLSIARCEEVVQNRPKLVRFAPVFEGQELPFIYTSDETTLTLETARGKAELTFDGPDILRARVTGVGLRFFLRPQMHEGGFERAPGEVEVAFNMLGKLLFKSLSGVFAHNAVWDFEKVCPFPFDIDILPAADGAGEAAIHEYYSNGGARQSYADFDEVRARGVRRL